MLLVFFSGFGVFLGTFGHLGILVGFGVFRLDCDLGCGLVRVIVWGELIWVGFYAVLFAGL